MKRMMMMAVALVFSAATLTAQTVKKQPKYKMVKDSTYKVKDSLAISSDTSKTMKNRYKPMKRKVTTTPKDSMP